mmetsp:Transcript_42934/g.103773  ORF Transcript_42934/g.103773 Transcript_42934/m.103773 type:complete len:181 (+) Transcript_42934:76-618(+)
MGGIASQPVSGTSTAEAAAEEETATIFSLSEDLQAQMAQDFHNDQVVRLFGKQLEKIGERKQSILQERLEQRSVIQQHMDQFRQQNSQVQKQLDESIEKHEDKFADTANVLEYDMERLTKKYLGNSNSSDKSLSSKIPCLTERSDIATCYQQHKSDPDKCSLFVKELVNCTEKTITQQQA